MADDLLQALLQFAEAPGKYSVRRRQPTVLFARLTDVLQLASQREAPTEGDTSRAVQAARFFVQTALLHPEADPHAVLGVEEGAGAGLVKERYRLLMRLLHPDFASAQAGWPADAAARVNRAYDYVSAGGAAPKPLPVATSPAPIERAARPSPKRPKAGAAVAWNLPKSRLKHAFLLLGFIGAGLMLVVLGIDRQSPVHLVQKPQPPKARETERDVTPEPPRASISATLSELLSDVSNSSSLLMSTQLGSTPPPEKKPAPPIPVTQSPSIAAASRTPARPAPRTETLAQEDPAPPSASARSTVGSLATRAEAATDPAPAPPETVRAAVAAAPPPPVNPTPVPPVPPVQAAAAPAPRPGLTLAEAQPLLVALLQQMESGRGDRMLSLLEPDARQRPAAQAFSRTYDGVVDGARVKLAQVQFRAEPAEGKLVVQGQMRVVFTDSPATATRKFILQAEFVNRNGTVVLTGLSGGPVN